MEKPRLRERKGDRNWPKKAQTGTEEPAQGVALQALQAWGLEFEPTALCTKSSEAVFPVP